MSTGAESPGGGRRDRGLTLIELVVAMAVFALVAIMGLQSLTGTLRQRDRAAAFAADSAALGRAVGLLRQDLATAMPLMFFAPGGGRRASAMSAIGGGGFALSVGAVQPYGPLGQNGLVRRVEYRLVPGEGQSGDGQSGGRLTRAEWPTLWPVAATQKSPDVTVLQGVRGLTFRSYWSGVGWIDGLRFAALDSAPKGQAAEGQDQVEAGPEAYSDYLPLAVEITLATEDFGAITLLETLQ